MTDVKFPGEARDLLSRFNELQRYLASAEAEMRAHERSLAEYRAQCERYAAELKTIWAQLFPHLKTYDAALTTPTPDRAIRLSAIDPLDTPERTEL